MFVFINCLEKNGTRLWTSFESHNFIVNSMLPKGLLSRKVKKKKNENENQLCC